MAERISLVQAQRRYIARRNSSTTGHWRRTANAAAKELRKYLARIGVTDEKQVEAILKDARDIAILEKECGDED